MPRRWSKEERRKVRQLYRDGDTQESISEITGIPRGTVHSIIHSKDNPANCKSHGELVSWIKSHTEIVFGENIKWHWDCDLYNEDNEYSPVRADLLGVDIAGCCVIVEVKLDAPDRSAVGQILEYACALILDPPSSLPIDSNRLKLMPDCIIRLFIVGRSISRPVLRTCEYLKAHGINISHLSVV